MKPLYIIYIYVYKIYNYFSMFFVLFVLSFSFRRIVFFLVFFLSLSASNVIFFIMSRFHCFGLYHRLVVTVRDVDNITDLIDTLFLHRLSYSHCPINDDRRIGIWKVKPQCFAGLLMYLFLIFYSFTFSIL